MPKKPKTQTFDITPAKWAEANYAVRGRVLSHVMRVGFCEMITITKESLLIVAEKDMKMGVGALYTLIEKVAAGTPKERDLQAELAEFSCRDNSCWFWPLGVFRGMATNAGCRCFKDLPFEQRERVYRVVRILQDLAQEREA